MKRWRRGEVDCRVRQAAGGAPRDAKWSCLFKDLQFYFWILSCVSIREPGERGAGGSPSDSTATPTSEATTRSARGPLQRSELHTVYTLQA